MNDVSRIANLYEKVDRIMYSASTPLKKAETVMSDKAKLARERDIERQKNIDKKTLSPEDLRKKQFAKKKKEAEEAVFNRIIRDSKFLLDLDSYGVLLNKKREERGYPPIVWDIVFNEEGRRASNIPADRRSAFIDNYYNKNNIMMVVSPAGRKPSNWIIAHRVGHGLLVGNALNQLISMIKVFRITAQGEEDRNISEEEFFKMVSTFKSVAQDNLDDKDEY
jgi:hypothetical protein